MAEQQSAAVVTLPGRIKLPQRMSQTLTLSTQQSERLDGRGGAGCRRRA
jgi:hypothetical protein